MKKLIKTSALALAGLMYAGTADAAGFHLSEYSATGMGRAFAGAGVVGDDYSAIGFNPAGMQYNRKSGGQAGISVVSLHADYKGSIDTTATMGPNGTPIAVGSRSGSGHTRITRALPNFFGQYKINPDTTFGMGLYVPYGLATDYENGWFAESHAGLSQISAVNISPALSYQINKLIAVGGAINFQYTDARITGAVEQGGLYFQNGTNDLRGDDLGVGYTLGLTITPRDDIRLGVSYRSKIKQKLKGTVETTGMDIYGANGKSDIFAKVTTPEVITFSGAYNINRCFTLSGTARWTRWSQFKSLDIYKQSDGSLLSGTEENWKNTWYYAIGLDYNYNKNWTFRTGLGYDETVIKSSDYRTARIPDGRRVLASLGASYRYQNWQIDAGYTHIFLHGGRAQGEAEGASAADIKYSSDAEMLSMGIQYKF